MTRQLPGLDTQPWYRQFWPWFLILLPASVVVAALSTAYIASEGADDLVVEDYYKDGLAINRQLEKKERAQQLGLSAIPRFSTERVTVTIAGPVSATPLQLVLSHPMEADRDFTVTLVQKDPHTFVGTLVHPIAPHWHWTLAPLVAPDWRLDGEVQATDIDDVPRD